MYSTNESIMFPAVGELYPFLDQIRDYDDYDYDLDDYEYDEYAIYPVLDDEHEDCYCKKCNTKYNVYEPPTTRLQARNKQSLIAITTKIIDSYSKLSYYCFEYMEEQKSYTKRELEEKLEEPDVYITEEAYRNCCDRIKDRYEQEKEHQKLFNTIGFTQFLMVEYEFDGFMKNCIEHYKKNMDEVEKLQNKICKIK